MLGTTNDNQFKYLKQSKSVQVLDISQFHAGCIHNTETHLPR